MTEKDEKINSKRLEEYIKHRQYILETAEVLYAIDIYFHPQINHIIFKPENSEYNMWDKYGNYFNFIALNYEEKREDYVRKRELK